MLKIDPDCLILGTENYIYLHSTIEKNEAKVEYCGWLDCEADPRVMGFFIWTGIDYLGEAWQGWPRNGSINALMDVTNFVRPVGDFYRTLWMKDEPQVHLDMYRMKLGDENEWRHMWDIPRMDRIYETEDDMISVATYTTCEEVELVLNGRSLGVQKLADHPNRVLNWTFAYEPGELKAIGRNGGEVVAECTRTTPGTPARLALSPAMEEIRANSYDVVHVETTLVDANGVECHWDEGEKVTFSVEGPGEVHRVGNGLLNAEHPYLGNVAWVGNDRCYALIRATAPGKITLRATCGDFTGELVLDAVD